MSTRIFRGAFALGAVLLFGALLSLMLWTPLRIQYHRSYVETWRTSPQEPTRGMPRYLSIRWLRWRLEGRPDISRQMELRRQHEDVLIKMGYFERHTYTFTNEFKQGFVEAVRHGPLTDQLVFFEFRTDSVEVLAHRKDFPRITKLIQEYRAVSPYE
jgi:hypothetical protein